MNANQIHSTVTYPNRGKYAWSCQDCPAKARGYETEKAAKRIAAIHENPAATPSRRH